MCVTKSVYDCLSVFLSVCQDLFNAGNWLVANKLSINVAKTEHMFFGSKFRLSNLGKKSQFS